MIGPAPHPEVAVHRVATAPGVTLALDVRPGRPGATPFLLVHGLSSNARLWDGVGAVLAGRGHGSGAVDLRGHGRSSKPDDGYDVTTVTDDLLGVLDHLGWPRPIAVGQSWGGNLVLELGRRFPDRLAGVACIDGGTIDLADRFADWEACRAALTPPPTTGRPVGEVAEQLRRAHPGWPASGIESTLANFEIRADGTVAPWLSLDRHLLVLRGLWEHRPRRLYPEVRVPMLLVPAGPADEQRRAAIAEAAGALPQCRVQWIDGDHDLHAQYPARIADLLAGAVDDGFFR